MSFANLDYIVENLIFPLVVTIVGTIVGSVFVLLLNRKNKTTSKKEYILLSNFKATGKKEYINLLKSNYYIKQTFLKIAYLKSHKYTALLPVPMGMSIGLVYSLLGFSFLSIFLTLSSEFGFLSHQLLDFDTDINKTDFLLFLGFCSPIIIVVPLLIAASLLLYFKSYGTKKRIITKTLIKRKKIGKITQILHAKIFTIAKPDFTNEMLLTRLSELFFYSFPFLITIIFIVNFFVYAFIFNILCSRAELPFSLSIENMYSLYYFYFYSNIESVFSDYWEYIYIYIIFNVGINSLYVIALYIAASDFLKEAKKEIINNYSEGYPYVSIKTHSGKLAGKIEDVFNKNVIILKENGVLKSTSWDNVEIFEFKKL